MNYLAHLFLAGEEPGLIVGALLEDYVVGGIEVGKNKAYPESVKAGLKLHRFIDSYTDTSAILKPCKELFYPDFGKYSPVIIDILLDHYLQKNWDSFTKESFNDFRKRIYYTLNHHFVELQPPGLRRLVDSMTHHDWLKNYIQFWGIEKALSSLNSRVTKINLADATSVMKTNYGYLERCFLDFFPELKAACNTHFLKNGR